MTISGVATKNLVTIMNQKGFTQDELSKRCSLSKPTIARIMRNGRKAVRLDVLLELCSALNISISQVFTADKKNKTVAI